MPKNVRPGRSCTEVSTWKVVLGERRRTVTRREQVARLEAEEEKPAIGEHEQATRRAEVVDPRSLKDGDHANDPLAIRERIESQLALRNRARVSRFGAIGVNRELGEQAEDDDRGADERVAHGGPHSASPAFEPKLSFFARLVTSALRALVRRTSFPSSTDESTQPSRRLCALIFNSSREE